MFQTTQHKHVRRTPSTPSMYYPNQTNVPKPADNHWNVLKILRGGHVKGHRSESPPLGVCCSPCPSQCWAPCSYSASGTSPSSLCEESANHQPLLPADGCVSPFHLLITKDQPVSFYLVNTALPGSVFCYISNSYKQKPCVEGDLSTSTTLFLFREPTCAQRRSVACHHPVTRHLHR